MAESTEEQQIEMTRQVFAKFDEVKKNNPDGYNDAVAAYDRDRKSLSELQRFLQQEGVREEYARAMSEVLATHIALGKYDETYDRIASASSPEDREAIARAACKSGLASESITYSPECAAAQDYQFESQNTPASAEQWQPPALPGR